MLDAISDHIESLSSLVNNKEALDEEQIEHLTEEAESALEWVTSHIFSVLDLGDRIHYLTKAPGLESYPYLYEEVKAKEQEVDSIYDQLIDLEREAKDIVEKLQ